MKDWTKTDVKSCARCGKDHSDLLFSKFQKPIVDCDEITWNFWGMCPITHEPILLRLEEDELSDKS